MIRRPPRSTQSRSSAASDVYKRQLVDQVLAREVRQGVDGQAFARPAQDGLDAGEQLRVVERLCQVVVGATLEALHDVMRFVERREHDDWDVLGARIRAEAPRDLPAVYVRHHYVQDYYVGLVHHGRGEPSSSADGGYDVVALDLEVGLHHLEQALFVIDKQYFPFFYLFQVAPPASCSAESCGNLITGRGVIYIRPCRSRSSRSPSMEEGCPSAMTVPPSMTTTLLQVERAISRSCVIMSFVTLSESMSSMNVRLPLGSRLETGSSKTSISGSMASTVARAILFFSPKLM